MASKVDSILRRGMDFYGAAKPIAQVAAAASGSTQVQQAVSMVDRNVAKAAQRYQGARDRATQGAALVERLSSSIGGY